MKRQPTVFVVDSDAGMRQLTATLLDSVAMTCVTYDSASAFLNDFQPSTPGCLLLNMFLRDKSGLEVIEQLRAQDPDLPVLAISETGPASVAVQAMKLGVVDFLEKPVDPDVLLSSIRVAIELDAQRRANSAAHAELRQRLAGLTTRERELLKLLVAGESNKSIAAKLGISIKTVENHRAHIMHKTGATNAADLVRMSLLS